MKSAEKTKMSKKTKLIRSMHKAICDLIMKNPKAEPEVIKNIGEVILENRLNRIEKDKPVKLKITTRLLEKAEGSIREAAFLEAQHNQRMDAGV